MFNPLTLPPKLMLRALDDLNAIAEAVRRLPGIEESVEATVLDVRDDLKAMRASTEPLVHRLDGLAAEMAPIGQLPALLDGLGRLETKLDGMSAKLDGLSEQMSPIAELPELR